SLSIFEIIALFVSAIVIGFVVNFFYSTRKGMKKDMEETKKSVSSGIDEWKLKYMKEAERKDKEISDLKSRLHIADENKRIYDIEMQELKNQVKTLGLEAEQAKTVKPVLETRVEYYEQLR